jgi:hypothetical protein
MKNVVFLFLVCCVSSATMAQLTTKSKCGTFVVDLLNGNVNNMKPSAPIAEIKAALPCSTGIDDESGTSKCGGGIYYKDRDISFYTGRDYIEIGEKFKGQLSIPIMGAPRNSLFKWLGNPKMKDDNWDAFAMSYGTLVLHYNAAGKVRLIQFSTRGTDELSLCE